MQTDTIDIDNIIVKYIQNQCSDSELEELRNWLAESEENRKEFFSLEAGYRISRASKLYSGQYADNAFNELSKKIQSYESKRKLKYKLLQYTKYAAMIAVLLGCVCVLANKNLGLTDDMIAVNTNDEVKKLELPDGTKVWVNKHSSFEYPAEFNSDNVRNVKLNGEAYFEVVSNKEKPFIVTTEAIQITVLGTTFSLQSYCEDSLFYASLVEGSIEVKSKTNQGTIYLKPGQKLEYNKETGGMSIENVNTKLDAVWHNNLIPFEEATINDIAKTLSALYDIKIIVAPHVLNNTTYSGELKKYSKIEEVLNNLNNSIPIKYTITKEYVYITAPTK